MPIVKNEYSDTAKGGTEAMVAKLDSYLSEHAPELLDYFDIFPARVRNFDETHHNVFWAHDLERDPETNILRDQDKFELIVFVSDWQFQQYQAHYGLNGHNCVVINNAIDFPEVYTRKISKSPIKLIYHTTPHRGLEILLPAFDEVNKQLKEEGIKTKLDVYSSFKIYGWGERDEGYKELFKFCKDHEDITYHGTVPNEKIREALLKSHIFAYPSIWQETSCISLIEAMASRVACVHSNLGALPDTSGGLTFMYPYVHDKSDHQEIFASYLYSACKQIHDEKTSNLIETAYKRTELLFDWEKVGPKWVKVLSVIKESNDN